jgi:hypothetical protein
MSTVPEGPLEVLIWPLLCTILGIVVWYVGLRIEFNTEKAFAKWLAMIPLGIGAFLGVNAVSRAMDFGYQEILDRKMTLYAHYVALAMPVLAIAAIIVWNWYQKRQNAQDIF